MHLSRMEGLEDRLAPATFTVLNTNNGGAGSLRAAINSANAASGADEATVHVTGTQATGQIEIQALEPGWGERIVVSAQAGNGDGSTHMYCPGFPYGYHDF